MNSSPDDQFSAFAAEAEIEWPEITRQMAALFQIHGAIKLFHKGEIECSITLAGAAEGILPDDLSNTSLYKVLRKHQEKKLEKLGINFVQNWLKHGTFKLKDGKPIVLEKVRITPFLGVFSIQRAITKFAAVYGGDTPQMAKFMEWCKGEGYPGPSRTLSKRRRPPRLRLVSSN